jgi:multidrug efflux pump subunit AcrA (membrane-fusion protein)
VGLNATVEVIGGQTQNAVLVPVEALRELSEGQYALFVMEDGEPKLRTVEVGLMDFTFAEILSGVAEGEVVTTGIVETQ